MATTAPNAAREGLAESPQTTPALAPERDEWGHPVDRDEAPEDGSSGTSADHRRAFEALFERYHARIYDYVARTLNDGDEAADVTQDVFLSAYRNLPETAARGDFRAMAWLYRIATNRCIDVIRHRRLVAWCSLDRLLPWRDRRSTALLLEPAAPYLCAGARDPATSEGAGEVVDPVGWGDPQRLTLEHERANHVLATLDRLRVQHRTVLLLREYHDLSYDEIAEVLATTRAAVKSLLFRAREEFRQAWPCVSPDSDAITPR
jgi:RNA polymerase sigma-70 factor (ECF subfamily)